MKLVKLAVVVALAGALSSCGTSSKTASAPTTSTASVSTTSIIPGIDVACADLAQVLGDQQKGILTDAELRDRFKAMYADAQQHSPAGLTKAAQDVLAADTAGVATLVSKAEDTMSTMCLDDLKARSATTTAG